MKKSSSLFAILYSLFAIPIQVYADPPEGHTAAVSTLFSDGLVNPVNKFSSISDILNKLLPYLLTGAGLILFGMLIMGGFDMLMAATDAKKVDAGKARITAALTGFIIIFASYWIIQILEILLGIKILSQ